MEIPGLVPCQSETQYLEGKFRVSASGNKEEPKWKYVSALLLLRFHFVAAFRPPGYRSGNIVEIYFHFTQRQVQWR